MLEMSIGQIFAAKRSPRCGLFRVSSTCESVYDIPLADHSVEYTASAESTRVLCLSRCSQASCPSQISSSWGLEDVEAP